MQLVAINKLGKVSLVYQQENQIKGNGNSNTDSMDAQVLEQGDIYFFYRPKKSAEDIRRFFMVTAVFMNYHYNMKKAIDHNAVYRDKMSLIFSIG